MKKLITISILTALSGIAVASAQGNKAEHGGSCGGGHGMGGMHKFEDLDANKDGKVTRDEMLSRATTHFDQADADKNGTVTPAERKVAFEKRAEERFTKQDKNKDGALSTDEVPPHFARFATKLDANKDGKLTRDELRAFGKEHEKDFAARFGADKPHTRADLTAHVGQRFDKLDANHDGSLTEDEMTKGRRFHHRHHGAGEREEG